MRRLVPVFLLIPYFLVSSAFAGDRGSARVPASTPKSDAMLQGFYWNSPPGGIWWDSLAKLAPRLAAGGFSAIWFPSPVKCATGSVSMGYDPYDHYDFGEYNQYGSVETRFGGRQELINSINVFHQNGISVLADAVMGHMDGGEQLVPYDCDISPTLPSTGYLIFNYPSGSGRFKKSAINFYPNHLSTPSCDWNPANYHGVDPAFKFGEYLALTQPAVRDSLIVWGQYLRHVIGFDGFRLDEAKAIDPAFIGPWLQAADSNGFAVAEYFGSGSEIGNWHNLAQNVNGGKVSMFDFPLRFALQSMCNTTSGFYDMTQLDNASLTSNGWSGFDVVTFVENHDFDRVGWDGSVGSGNNPIVTDKHMAYAFIMFSEGRPCVFFKDYFTYGLAPKIDTLNWIRRTFLGGSTTFRSGLNPYYIRQDNYTDQGSLASDIYVARRNGYGSQPGGYLVINDESNMWIDVWVDTELPVGTVYRDYTGHDVDKVVVGPASPGGKNRVKLWGPPRNYTIYVADTTQRILLPPSLGSLPARNASINSAFSAQLPFNNPSGDTLSFSLSGNPGWLSVNSSGVLSGTADSITASYPITVRMSDTRGDTSVGTFTLNVISHPAMDGLFEGPGIWGAPIAVADSSDGFNGARVQDLYVTADAQYYYFGAHVKARQGMAWAFALNTRSGGGPSDSWGRSILYGEPNPPDFVLRGSFNGGAEFNIWIGPFWGGVGTQMAATEYGDTITSDSAVNGWVEARILRSSISNAQVVDVQCYISGSAASSATFDACPDDENTTQPSGITTTLHRYAVYGTPRITFANLFSPGADTIGIGDSAAIRARVSGVGVTDTGAQNIGVEAWIGMSQLNNNPSGWSDWIPAAFTAKIGGIDEYQANIGQSILSQGTYYYASRFRFNGGQYVYGGFSGAGGGIWDSVHYRSGVLTVLGPPSPPALFSPPNGSNGEAPITDCLWNAAANALSYRIQVARDSLFAQIILDDSSIASTQKHLTGLQVDSTYFWRVRSKGPYGIGSFSQPWAFTVSKTLRVYAVASGWNMLSVPMSVTDPRRTTLYPNAITNAFAFSSAGSYVIADSLMHGTGYWLKFAGVDSANVVGLLLHRDSIAVSAGWNLIGSVSDTVVVDSILQLPPAIVTSSYFGYDGGYVRAFVILPGQAYWAKTSSDGVLVLSPSPSAAAAVMALRSAQTVESEQSAVVLKITDATGQTRRLTVCFPRNQMAGGELPPLPPQGILDARFEGNTSVLAVGVSEAKGAKILVSAGAYPVTVEWGSLSGDGHAYVLFNGREIPMSAAGAVTLRSPDDRIAIHASGAQAIPSSYALRQNYPNPFNPSTTIPYELPVDSRVAITIYSVLGDVVARIADGVQTAGFHTAQWTPMSNATGIYFYRIEASDIANPHNTFSAVKKLLLVR